MPVERSAGIIFFRNTPKRRKYLVLRSSRGSSTIAEKKKIKEFWDFPKGRLEPGETGIDAARREAEEEAGIKDFEIFPHFKETVSYFTWRGGKPIRKFAALFLARAKEASVKLSWEHDKYKWLAYNEALRRVTLREMKRALEQAEKYLSKMSNS